MFKNRASIVAVMGLVSLLIQFGCDPLGLMTPANNQLTNFPYGSPNGAVLQNPNIAAGNPYLAQGSTAAYPSNYVVPASTAGYTGYSNPSNATFGPNGQGYNQTIPFDNRSLLVASFNIQVFGVNKVGDSDTTRILVDIVRKFDLVAIQELRSTDQQVLDRFLAMVNADGGTYRYVVGERLGYTISKEQYVYVFDAAKLRVTEQPFTVPDPTGVMHRPPLATRFQSLQLPENQAFTFTLLNVHTDPDNVPNELKALQYVIASVRQNMSYEDDVIVLGDFNAPTRQIDTCQWLPYQFAAIRDNWPTNVREDRNYDNLVFDGQATNEYTGKSGVLNFRQLYQLQLEDARDVSDHFPVWAEFSIFENRNSVLAGSQTWPVSR